MLSCGDTVDKRLDGKVLTSKITITFRSNEKVRRIGGRFFVYEYAAMVSKPVSILAVCMCVCLCMYTCTSLCLCAFVCVCTYVCVYDCAYMYACGV